MQNAHARALREMGSYKRVKLEGEADPRLDRLEAEMAASVGKFVEGCLRHRDASNVTVARSALDDGLRRVVYENARLRTVHALLTPINAIPDELVLMILDDVLADEYDYRVVSECLEHYRSLARLSAVCRRWRDLLHRPTSRHWRTMVVRDAPDPHFYDRHRDRRVHDADMTWHLARNAPDMGPPDGELVAHVKRIARFAFVNDKQKVTRVPAIVVDLMTHHMSQLRHLYLHVCADKIAAMIDRVDLPACMPNLEVVDVTFPFASRRPDVVAKLMMACKSMGRLRVVAVEAASCVLDASVVVDLLRCTHVDDCRSVPDTQRRCHITNARIRLHSVQIDLDLTVPYPNILRYLELKFASAGQIARALVTFRKVRLVVEDTGLVTAACAFDLSSAFTGVGPPNAMHGITRLAVTCSPRHLMTLRGPNGSYATLMSLARGIVGVEAFDNLALAHRAAHAAQMPMVVCACTCNLGSIPNALSFATELRVLFCAVQPDDAARADATLRAIAGSPGATSLTIAYGGTPPRWPKISAHVATLASAIVAARRSQPVIRVCYTGPKMPAYDVGAVSSKTASTVSLVPYHRWFPTRTHV